MLEHLKDLEAPKRKTILSALVIITDKKPYRDAMMADIAKYNSIMDTQMVFNKYKTAKTYKQQTLTVPPELKSILNKWIKVNPSDFLFFDTNGSQLTNVKMTQRLNKIFGKKSSVNSLRHSYLTNKFGSQIEIQKEMDKAGEDMGTSASTIQQIYLKK